MPFHFGVLLVEQDTRFHDIYNSVTNITLGYFFSYGPVSLTSGKATVDTTIAYSVILDLTAVSAEFTGVHDKIRTGFLAKLLPNVSLLPRTGLLPAAAA